MAKKKLPLKPAKEIVALNFPKDGPVTREAEEWPRTKEAQELRIVELFAETLLAWRNRNLEGVQPLPEMGHDVVAIEAGVRIEIQVTELVTRDALRDLGDGQVGWAEGDFDQLLLASVLRKVKGYGPNRDGRLMLVVYSVDPGAFEFCEFTQTNPETGQQELGVPQPLQAARRYLEDHGAEPFDEVWYTAPSPEWAQISPVFPPSLYT